MALPKREKKEENTRGKYLMKVDLKRQPPKKTKNLRKKMNYLKQYVSNYGNISGACVAIDISRRTYYNWMESDEWFKGEIEQFNTEIPELEKDFLKISMVNRIKEGSDSILKVALENKLGWGKKHKVEHSGAINVKGYTIVSPDDFPDNEEQTNDTEQ